MNNEHHFNAAKNIVMHFNDVTVVLVRGAGRFPSVVAKDETGKVLEFVSIPSGDLASALEDDHRFVGGVVEGFVGEVSLFEKFSSETVTQYDPLEQFADVLLPVTEEDYKSLTASFKKKYNPVKNTVEQEKALETVHFRVEQDFDPEILKGRKFVSDLRGIVAATRKRERRRWGYGGYNREEPDYDFSRFAPTALAVSEVFGVLKHVIEQRGFRRGCGATVTVPYRVSNGDGEIRVEFLERTYGGETKKRYHKKKNGGYYADKRYDLVKDPPKAVGQATIMEAEVLEWYSSLAEDTIATDEAKMEAFRQFADFLYQVEQ